MITDNISSLMDVIYICISLFRNNAFLLDEMSQRYVSNKYIVNNPLYQGLLMYRLIFIGIKTC